MQRRRLGRTGHESSVAILGGAAFALATTDEAEPAFTAALARGSTTSTSPRATARPSERSARWSPRSATGSSSARRPTRRAADGVRAQLDESLQRLHTDHVDLYQLHGVTSVEVLDERAPRWTRSCGHANEGMTRFIGITGHGLAAPATFVEALRRYDLDTVMFPVYPRLWADVRLSTRGRGAARDLRGSAISASWQSRPWHANRGPTRLRSVRDHVVRAAPRSRLDRARRALRAVHTGRPRLLHAGRPRASCRSRSTRPRVCPRWTTAHAPPRWTTWPGWCRCRLPDRQANQAGARSSR